MRKQLCALSPSIAAAFCIVAFVYLSACAGGNFEIESDIPNAMPHGTSINGDEDNKSRLTKPTRRAKPGEEFSSFNGISQFPAFPADIGPARYAARADYPIVLTGSGEWDDGSAVHKGLVSYAPEGVSFDGNTINLDSGVADIICWAQYRIGDLSGDTIGELTVDGGTVPDGDAYDVFIANWSEQVWDIYRFSENDFGGASIDLSSHASEYISQSGLFVWIFVVLDGTAGFVNQWSLTGEGELDIPENVSASDGTYSDKIRISWSAVEYADQYHIYRDTAQDGDFTGEIAGSPVTGTEIDDTSIPDADTYWYKVKAANANGVSGFSEADSGYIDPIPPIAEFTADPSTGAPPLAVNFDASTSYDPDGEIVKYEWDWTSDGTIDLDSGNDPTVQNTYENYGVYTATVTVTDNHGQTDAANVVINVYSTGWHVKTVESGIGAQSVSLEVIDGLPSIAFRRSGALAFVRANDTRGESWGTPTVVDSDGSTGGQICLTDVNGYPAVSYSSYTTNKLKYVISSTADGSAWQESVTLDDINNENSHDGWKGETSLAVIAGNPAISYRGSAGHLKYIRATESTGSNWSSALTLDSTGNTAFNSSMVIVNGNPAIAYHNATERSVRYIRATNSTGSSWGSPIVVLVTGVVGAWTSMAIVDGRPGISFYDESPPRPWFVRATNENGTAWGSPIVVDSSRSGICTSLAIIAGRPAVAYYHYQGGSLHYVRSNNAQGTAWGTPVTVDSGYLIGQRANLAEVAGSLGIAYQDGNSGSLKYAYYVE